MVEPSAEAKNATVSVVLAAVGTVQLFFAQTVSVLVALNCVEVAIAIVPEAITTTELDAVELPTISDVPKYPVRKILPTVPRSKAFVNEGTVSKLVEESRSVEVLLIPKISVEDATFVPEPPCAIKFPPFVNPRESVAPIAPPKVNFGPTFAVFAAFEINIVPALPRIKSAVFVAL